MSLSLAITAKFKSLQYNSIHDNIDFVLRVYILIDIKVQQRLHLETFCTHESRLVLDMSRGIP